MRGFYPGWWDLNSGTKFDLEYERVLPIGRMKKMFDKLKSLTCKHSWAIDFYTIDRIYGYKSYERYCLKCGKRHSQRIVLPE